MPSTKCGFPYENTIYVTKKTEKKKAKNYIIAWKTMQIAGKTAVACIHFGTWILACYVQPVGAGTFHLHRN